MCLETRLHGVAHAYAVRRAHAIAACIQKSRFCDDDGIMLLSDLAVIVSLLSLLIPVQQGKKGAIT